MKVAVFSTKPYDRRFLRAANQSHDHDLTFLEPRLGLETLPLAAGHEGVCAFVNDRLDEAVLDKLAGHGVKLIALRCAGFNHVDLAAAARLGMTVARVPAYSPYAVAEHTLALMLTLNRKVHRAFNRVREGNFAIDGLLGFDMHGRTAGVVGTGRIGAIVAQLLAGFGCKLLAYDVAKNEACTSIGVEYVDLDTLIRSSDIITLHCPLTPQTHHLICDRTVRRMKPGVMLINTSRGALIDARSVIAGLKTGRIGSVAMDVYEEEADVFFEDLSGEVLLDDVLARLLTFPNALITSHQAFFTEQAMRNIADTTLRNVTQFEQGAVDAAHRVAPSAG